MLRDLIHATAPARDAIVRSVTRVGESITFSAATVIAAVLTLLLASFSFYSDLGVPFAIAIGVTLVAALTLLPALLSIRLSLLAVKRTAVPAPCSAGRSCCRGTSRAAASRASGAGWPAASCGTRCRPWSPASCVFGGLAFAVLGYTAAGFGGNTTPPAGSDSAAGQALLTKHFPQSVGQPDQPDLPVRHTRSGRTRRRWPPATSKLQASGLFTQVAGPLNPAGAPLTPAQFTALHAKLGPAKALPPVPPPGSTVPPAAYEAYRATANYVSPDGRTVQYSTGLKAGDPGSTAGDERGARPSAPRPPRSASRSARPTPRSAARRPRCTTSAASPTAT